MNSWDNFMKTLHHFVRIISFDSFDEINIQILVHTLVHQYFVRTTALHHAPVFSTHDKLYTVWQQFLARSTISYWFIAQKILVLNQYLWYHNVMSPATQVGPCHTI